MVALGIFPVFMALIFLQHTAPLPSWDKVRIGGKNASGKYYKLENESFTSIEHKLRMPRIQCPGINDVYSFLGSTRPT